MSAAGGSAAGEGPDPVGATLAALPFGLWIYGADGRLAYANPAAWELVEVLPRALPAGSPLEDVVRLLAYRGVFGSGDPEAQAREHLRLDRTRPLRRLLRRADGRVLELRTVPLPGGGFCSVARDVSDQVAATEEAARRARRLETVLAHLHGGVALFDANRRLLLNNDRYEGLLGLPRGTVRPGMTQDAVLALLAGRGEFANDDPETLLADRQALDRMRPQSWHRERPSGEVIRFASQPLSEDGGGYVVELTEITALKRAEDEARRRAALLDGVLAALPHGVLVFDSRHRVAMVNDAYRRIMAGSEVAVGEHREAIARRRAEAGEYGPGEVESLVRRHTPPPGDPAAAHRRRARPDGTVLDIRTAPLPDGGCVLVTTDITALHQAEAEARDRSRLLQAMLDNMRHGIALYGADRRLVTANALAARLLGLAPGAMRPGRRVEEVVAEQVAAGELAAATAERSLAALFGGDGGRPVPFSSTRARPDGTVLEVIADPTPDGGFVVTYSDVTARALAEAEAEARAATLQATIDNLRHGIIVYGADRRVRAANRLAAELSGNPPGAIRPGRLLDEVVREMAAVGALEPGPRAEALVARIIGYDRSVSNTNVRRTRDGRVIEVHSDPLPDGGFIVSHVDITRAATAEAEARARAAELRAMLDNTRHGIALYGPDRRLVAANALAALLSGLAPGEMAPGRRLDELLDLQRARGVFGADKAEARAVAEALKRQDRSRHRSVQRARPDGRILEIASDPTPDGGFVVSWSDITARAAAEAAARERAAVLQATLDNVRHGIAMYGPPPERRLVTANRLAGPGHGLPPLEDRVGARFEDLVREQLEQGIFGEGGEAEATAARVLALDRAQSHRYQRRLPGGRVIEVGSDPTPDGGFVITHSDVTGLVQAQAEASRRADILQAMLDNMRHGIALYDADRRLVAANALASDLGGHRPGFLVPGRTLEELIAQQLEAGAVGGGAAERVAAMALAMDRSRPHRYLRPHRDGRIVEVTSDPTPDGGFVVTMSDITALAGAEAEAKRRAEIQQAMLDNIRHGILLVDAPGRVVAANPVFRQLLGVPEELVAPGRPFTDFVDFLAARGEYGEGAQGEAAAAAIRTRDRARSIRTVRARPDGTVVEAVSDPTPDGGWVLTFTDLTEERRVQAELERARDAAEAANRAKSRFLATMSHELRTPLNAVIGFSEALMANPGAAAAPDYVRSIHEAGRHLLGLIDDILDVARAETTGGFPVSEGVVDLAALVEGAVRVMGATAAAGGVALRCELAPGLPALRADELRLRQVLLNLLSNAVKFTPPGGSVTVSAALEAAAEGEAALALRIADTGIGMSPEEIPRAFEPFTQLDGTLARRFAGSGLGLYLSRALAAAQGAALALESAPGRGTTAVLRFPQERFAAAAGAGGGAAAGAAIGSSAAG